MCSGSLNNDYHTHCYVCRSTMCSMRLNVDNSKALSEKEKNQERLKALPTNEYCASLFKQGGQNMTRRPASLGPFGKRQLFLCQGWDGTNPVVGTYDGHIYRYVQHRFRGRDQQVSGISMLAEDAWFRNFSASKIYANRCSSGSIKKTRFGTYWIFDWATATKHRWDWQQTSGVGWKQGSHWSINGTKLVALGARFGARRTLSSVGAVNSRGKLTIYECTSPGYSSYAVVSLYYSAHPSVCFGKTIV